MPLRKKTPPPMPRKSSDQELGETEKRSRWSLFQTSRTKDKSASKNYDGELGGNSASRLTHDSGYGGSELNSSEASTQSNSLVGNVSQTGGVSPLSGGAPVTQETHHDPESGKTVTTTTTTTTTTVTTTGPEGTHTIAMPNNQVPPQGSSVQTTQKPTQAESSIPNPQHQDTRIQNPSNSRSVQFLEPGLPNRGISHQASRPETYPEPDPNDPHSPLTPPVPLRSAQRNSKDFGYFPGQQPGSQVPPPAQTDKSSRNGYGEAKPSGFNAADPNRSSSQSFVSRDDSNGNGPTQPTMNASTPTRQNFSYPGRSPPIPPQEMPADDINPNRTEPLKTEPQQQKGTLQGLKSTLAGIHGAGEALRGTVNASIDKRVNPHDAERAAKNEAVINRGRQELESRRLAHSHTDHNQNIHPNTTAGRFHSMLHSQPSPAAPTPAGGVEGGYTVPRKELRVVNK